MATGPWSVDSGAGKSVPEGRAAACAAAPGGVFRAGSYFTFSRSIASPTSSGSRPGVGRLNFVITKRKRA